MQGISHCRLCISKVLHGGVHPRVLHFAMSETPSTRGHYQGGVWLSLLQSPLPPVVKCRDPDFSSCQPAPQSELGRMLASECNGEQLKFSSREGRSFSEAFRRLFLTRENAKAFRRCHFRGTKKKRKLIPVSSWHFTCFSVLA